jgi:hypothetical protein
VPRAVTLDGGLCGLLLGLALLLRGPLLPPLTRLLFSKCRGLFPLDRVPGAAVLQRVGLIGPSLA